MIELVSSDPCLCFLQPLLKSAGQTHDVRGHTWQARDHLWAGGAQGLVCDKTVCVSFKVTAALLIFVLDVLSFDVSGVLNSPDRKSVV